MRASGVDFGGGFAHSGSTVLVSRRPMYFEGSRFSVKTEGACMLLYVSVASRPACRRIT